jgi:hypothetical protein
MTWLSIAPVILLAFFLLVVPGAALGYALGLRGVLTLTAAAPLSLTLIAGLAIVYTQAGIWWSLATFATGAAVLIVLVELLRRLISRRTGPLTVEFSGFSWHSFGLGLATSAVLAMIVLTRLFRDPSYFVQAFDNVFHLNAVQHILDSGRASSFTLTEFTAAGGSPWFYPAGWHDYTSLILGTVRQFAPSAPIGIAVNAATFAVIVSAWALGCLVLAQALAGGSPTISLLTAVMAPLMWVFPWAFLEWGGLYPNILSNAMVPSIMAILFLVANTMRPQASLVPTSSAAASSPESVPADRKAGLIGKHPIAVALVALAAAAPGMALTHPNSVFTVAIPALVLAWWVWLGQPAATFSRRWRGRLGWTALALFFATVAFAGAWIKLAPPRPTAPKPPLGLVEAFTALLMGASVPDNPATPAIAVVVIIGLIWAARQREFAVVATTVISAAIFLLAIGGPGSRVSVAVGGLFYNDRNRIAAFAVILALPAAIYAFAALNSFVENLTARLSPRPRLIWRIGAATATAAVIATSLTVTSLRDAIHTTASTLVTLSDHTQRVTSDEYELMRRIGDFVPAGQEVIADPNGGGDFIYAVSGVPVVFPHFFVAESTANLQLREAMFDRTQLAKTCAAMDELNAHYFYATSRWYTRPASGPISFPGLYHPDVSMLQEVDHQGTAVLYRFTACDR